MRDQDSIQACGEHGLAMASAASGITGIDSRPVGRENSLRCYPLDTPPVRPRNSSQEIAVRYRHWPLVVMTIVVSSAAASADDLTTISRKIGKEPKYVASRPLYGLVVFGPKSQTRAWAVLNKSRPDAPSYDVLYFDLAGQGDLTLPAHRFTAKGDKFHVGVFTDRATADKHTNLRVTVKGQANPDVMIRLQWQGGEVVMAGGYPEDPGEYMKFAADPAKAPVLWFHGGGNFRFQRWYGSTLTIGGSDDFKVFLGQQGIGRSSFCAVMHPFLPEKVPISATLHYTDTQGHKRHLQQKLSGSFHK